MEKYRSETHLSVLKNAVINFGKTKKIQSWNRFFLKNVEGKSYVITTLRWLSKETVFTAWCDGGWSFVTYVALRWLSNPTAIVICSATEREREFTKGEQRRNIKEKSFPGGLPDGVRWLGWQRGSGSSLAVLFEVIGDA